MRGTTSASARSSSNFIWPTIRRRLSTGIQDSYTQTIVRDAPVVVADTGILGLAAIRDAEQAKQLLVLYQLSIKLLGSDHPDDVVRIALELLQEQTRASIVGFLWCDDTGRLKAEAGDSRGLDRRRGTERFADRAGLPARTRRVDCQTARRPAIRQPGALRRCFVRAADYRSHDPGGGTRVP